MAEIIVSIFSYRNKDEGEVVKAYSFEDRKEAEDFAFDFNMIPQDSGERLEYGDKPVHKSMRRLVAKVSGETVKWDGSKIYIMHTVKVNHAKKLILSYETTIMTRDEIEEKRTNKPDSATVRAFDGMMEKAKTWENPHKAYKKIHKGVKSGTPLEEPDVVPLNAFSNDHVTYVSFLPNIRARISAVWDKTYLVNRDGPKDERFWIDAYYMHRCMDCNEDTSDIDEYYVVNDTLWSEAVPENHGMLCVGCLEQRAERRLNYEDFDPKVPLNWVNVSQGSERLKDRMTNSGSVHWDEKDCIITVHETGEKIMPFGDLASRRMASID